MLRIAWLPVVDRLCEEHPHRVATEVVPGPHVDVRALRGENRHVITVVPISRKGIKTHAVAPPLARRHTSARGRRVATATRPAVDNDLEGERLSVARPLKDGARAARHGWERNWLESNAVEQPSTTSYRIPSEGVNRGPGTHAQVSLRLKSHEGAQDPNARRARSRELELRTVAGRRKTSVACLHHAIHRLAALLLMLGLRALRPPTPEICGKNLSRWPSPVTAYERQFTSRVANSLRTKAWICAKPANGMLHIEPPEPSWILLLRRERSCCDSRPSGHLTAPDSPPRAPARPRPFSPRIDSTPRSHLPRVPLFPRPSALRTTYAARGNASVTRTIPLYATLPQIPRGNAFSSIYKFNGDDASGSAKFPRRQR